MKIRKDVYFGITMAATWAWGASLMVGLMTITERGLFPFMIWAAFNALVLPFFGFILRRLPHLFDYQFSPILKPFLIIIQLFAVWVQLNVIYETAILTGAFSEQSAKYFALAIGAGFVLVVIKNGLRISMFTDQIQYGFMVIGMAAMIILAVFLPLLTSGRSPDLVFYRLGFSWWQWMLMLPLMHFSGAFTELALWQRARTAVRERIWGAFNWGGAAFGFYMFLQLIAWHLGAIEIAAWIIFIVAMAVATSTLDSAAVALHEVRGSFVGAVIGAAAVIVWPHMLTLGVVGMWSLYATVRIYVSGTMIAIAIGEKRRNPEYTPEEAAKKRGYAA